MAAEAKHREAIVLAAADLFRQRGFAATGMNDIVAQSGAPKGSVYHYFPEGKAQIGAAALALAGRYLQARIAALAESEADPAALLQGVFARSAEALLESDFRHGCPVAGVVLDTAPTEARIMQAADAAMDLWRDAIALVCRRAAIPPGRAAFIASIVVSTMEGALIQARAARDIAPMTVAGEAIAMIVNAEVARAKGAKEASSFSEEKEAKRLLSV